MTNRAPPDHRSFLRRLPVTLLIAMAIWLPLRTIADSAVAAFAQLLIRSFEYPRVTRLVAEDHRVQVRRADLRTDSPVPALPVTEIHFNTIVLLALYLALPGVLSRRQLERLLMGWCVLYLTQAMNLVFHVKFMYASAYGAWSLQNYSDFARNFYGFWQFFTDLPGRFSAPFLIWLGFNWDVVMELLGFQPPPAEKRKRASKKRRAGRR